MQVVIPMSESGPRFARAGYTDPRPLIPVNGRPLIEHVIGMFPGVTDFVFVCSRLHFEQTPLESVLRNAAPTARIATIEPDERGSLYAVMQARHLIQDDEPVVVNPCDFSLARDFRRFSATVRELSCDGAVTACRGFHPHALTPNIYLCLSHENRRLTGVREEFRPVPEGDACEYVATGTAWYKSGELLKRYYRRAIHAGLVEPQSLMLADSLAVFVHELPHFLPWSTPDDLEDYRRWSDYFTRSAIRRASRASMRPGATLIPMAGDGARFARAGRTEPKPLVPVAGTPMLERALDTLPASSRTVAICRLDHLKSPGFAKKLRAVKPDIETIWLSHKTEGQACTCLQAESALDRGAPVMVAPCDCSLVYDEDAFEALAGPGGADCVAFTFRNHPHANRNPRQYGWVTTGPDGLAEHVECRIVPPGNVRAANGLTGMFWFREARMMSAAIRRLIAENRRIGDEFWLDSVLELLIEDGRRVQPLEVAHYIRFNTPEDVRTFEYWQSYFNVGQAFPPAHASPSVTQSHYPAVYQS